MIVPSKQLKLFFQHLQALYIGGKGDSVSEFTQKYDLNELWKQFLNETPWRPDQVFCVNEYLGRVDYEDLHYQEIFHLSAKLAFQVICGVDCDSIYGLAVKARGSEMEIERLSEDGLSIESMAPAADLSGIIAQKRPLIEQIMKLDLWRFPEIEAFINMDQDQGSIRELMKRVEELEKKLLDLSA